MKLRVPVGRRFARVWIGPGGGWAPRGMSTVEYALGTLAAAGFALGLMRILTSQRVQDLVTGVIEHALTKPF